MPSYTDESGLDGVVPAHPIECEGAAHPGAISAEPEDGATSIKLKGKDAEAFAARLEQPAQVKPELVELLGGAPIAEPEPHAPFASELDRLVSQIFSLMARRYGEPTTSTTLKAMLVQFRKQVVAEATVGLVTVATELRNHYFDAPGARVQQPSPNSLAARLDGEIALLSAAQRGEGE